jgi:hypothetical protein
VGNYPKWRWEGCGWVVNSPIYRVSRLHVEQEGRSLGAKQVS